MARLEEYNKKRNFEETVEPQGKGAKRSKSKKLRFVIQRHHASRLHYDFRLELDGLLKSWAVPKGPSLNPKDKRLAMHVEDHPLDYIDFEGSIPKGNYGAGVVHIYEEGTYEFINANSEKEFIKEYEEGSMKFILHGHRMKGEFALVKIKNSEDNAWLLIKHKDEFATDKSFDVEDTIKDEVKQTGVDFKKKSNNKKILSVHDVPKPMLTKLVNNLPEDQEEWLYEKKFDGFRIITVKYDNEIELYSRNGKNLNHLFPSVVKALENMGKECILDGEIVIEDAAGKSHFQLVSNGEPIPASYTLKYYIFDILELEGEVLTDFLLTQRKELLALLFTKIKSASILQLVDEINGGSAALIKLATKEGWEGLIAKRKDSTYHQGSRSSSWVKYKITQSQEAVICGFTKPEGGRVGFGALILGMYRKDELLYIGNVGSGFTDATIKKLMDFLETLRTDSKPFDKKVKVTKESATTWVRPELICEVTYSEWTKDERLRHPVFKGLREDKMINSIVKEEAMALEENDQWISIEDKELQLTNLDKVYWPKENYIKGQMIAYYEELSSWILPYIKDMPISMHRFPNGIAKESFFQKDVDPDKIPEWIQTAKMHSESTNKDIDYIICNDKATLLYLANLGSIEINPWLATYKKNEEPVFAVLDLDPNGADFEEVIRVAQTTKELLDHMQVKAFLKTSGSSGLHIYLYVDQKYTFEVVRDFVELLAQMVHEKHTETTSLVRSPKSRKGLIYLDYLQNRRGQTIVAPYSLRPKPGATVSTPLHWSELKSGLKLSDYTIKTIFKRIKNTDDPWKDIFSSPVNIKKALAKLS